MKIFVKRPKVYWIELDDGFKYELVDLYDTLSAIKNDQVMVDQPLAKKLIDLKVMKSNGSHNGGYGAKIGENFEPFYEKVEKLYLSID